MIAVSVIAGITFVMLTLSIVLWPSIRIRGHEVGTYWMVALLGAVAMLAAGLVSWQDIGAGLTADTAINPLKILVLFFAMTLLSVVLDEVGLFHFLANKAVAVAKTNQMMLFVVMYALTAFLTVFTSNDIVILTLTPFLCFFCKNARINPLPYLVGEFAAANTWSMMLVIGNPTNIYLATSANIGFVDYFTVMALPTLAAGMVEVGVIMLLFWRKLREPLHPQPDAFRVESKVDMVLGLVHLGACLVCLVVSGYIGVPMWLIAAIAAASLVVCMVVVRLVTRKHWRYLTGALVRLPWQLIPFVLAMFVMVIGLNKQGVSAQLAAWLGEKGCVWTYGLSSFVVANLINNIPMSMLYSALPVALPEAMYRQAIFATVVGSNIGAFLTPIGALAGIMFSTLATKYEVKYGFRQFVQYGSLISIPTLAAALGVLALLLA